MGSNHFRPKADLGRGMKLAVVIDLDYGFEAQQHAIRIQSLLLERLGAGLDSIRLAEPRLLRYACGSAVGEAPDALVIVGGRRAFRRAGQFAYERGLPILFLPGFRSPLWLRALWGSLCIQEMIGALEHGAIRPALLSAGNANGQIFFDTACCGLLPQLWQFRQAFADAESFSERWQAIGRGAALARFLARPHIRFRADAQRHSATAVLIRARHDATAAGPARIHDDILTCQRWQQGTFDALIGAAFKADWRQAPAQDLAARELVIENRRPSWLLLDGQPVRFQGPITMNRIAGAVQTFAFADHPQVSNNNRVATRRHGHDFQTAAEALWKLPPAAATGGVGPPIFSRTQH
jgi:hypothetical protein